MEANNIQEELLQDDQVPQEPDVNQEPIVKQPDGVIETRDENGQLIQYLTFKEGILQGKAELFNPDGSISQTMFFMENKLEGESEIYDDQGEELLHRLVYSDGLLNGVTKHYIAGSLSSEIHYTQGKQDGETVLYAPNGKICTRMNYLGGKLDGEYLIFNPETGDLLTKVTYKNNIIDGPWELYYPNGVAMEKKFYAQNKLEGRAIECFENGDVKKITHYKAGEAIGPPVEFDAKGKVVSG